MATYYSTDATWSGWTSTTSTCATYSTWDNWNSPTASADSSGTWIYWTALTPTTSGTSTTYSTSNVWVSWVDNGYAVSPPRETAEERRAREQRDAEYRAEQERQAKIRAEKEKAKEEKARQLLKEVLTEEQDAQLTKDGYFELTSVKSGKRYRIKKGFSMNVEELDKDGKRLRSMCFHPNVHVHHYDNMAIQKLMLENDEEEARKVANFN